MNGVTINLMTFFRFKLKYHPEDSAKRREEQRSALKRRIEVYQKFLNEGKIDAVTVDQDQSDSMVRLLDSVVILLEGGTDFDLQALDREDPITGQDAKPDDKEDSSAKDDKKEEGAEEGDKKENGDKEENGEQKDDKELQKAKEYLQSNGN